MVAVVASQSQLRHVASASWNKGAGLFADEHLLFGSLHVVESYHQVTEKACGPVLGLLSYHQRLA